MNIFVFGSNLAGRHGAGAARFAMKNHGALWGRGIGLVGNSYAIPTKDENIKTLPIEEITHHVRDFIQFAKNNPQLTFQLTPIGCGLAGYTYDQIGPLFKGCPENVIIPLEFLEFVK